MDLRDCVVAVLELLRRPLAEYEIVEAILKENTDSIEDMLPLVKATLQEAVRLGHIQLNNGKYCLKDHKPNKSTNTGPLSGRGGKVLYGRRRKGRRKKPARTCRRKIKKKTKKVKRNRFYAAATRKGGRDRWRSKGRYSVGPRKKVRLRARFLPHNGIRGRRATHTKPSFNVRSHPAGLRRRVLRRKLYKRSLRERNNNRKRGSQKKRKRKRTRKTRRRR